MNNPSIPTTELHPQIISNVVHHGVDGMKNKVPRSSQITMAKGTRNCGTILFYFIDLFKIFLPSLCP